LIEFTQLVTEIRDRYPVLRHTRFLTGVWNDELGIRDATWVHPSGNEMQPADWHDHDARCVGLLLEGRAQRTGLVRRADEATILLVFNAHHDIVEFTLPAVDGGTEWLGLLDTTGSQNLDVLDEPRSFGMGSRYAMTGRSMVALLMRPARRRPRKSV
jgi:glycogen operon protein